MANLTHDNIVTLDGKEWIMTKRQKTNVQSNILLLDIPKKIIEKYEGKTKKRQADTDSVKPTYELLSEGNRRCVRD